MALSVDEQSRTRSRLAVLRRHPRQFAGVIAVIIVIGLTISSPLVGIAVVVSMLLAGLYVGGRSPIAAVVVYVLMLYFVSPRLALGVYEVTPALLIGLLCIMLWGSGRAAQPHPHHNRSPLTTVVIGYTSVVVLTYGLGLTQPLLSEQLAGADRNLVKLLALVGVVLLILDVVRTERQLNQVLGLVVAGGTFVAAAALVQSFFDFQIVDQMRLPGFTDRGVKDTGLQLRLGLQRATGTARHPIELGTMAAIVLPLALHFSVYGKTARARASALTAALILIVAMLLSLSRSAYIGLFVAMIVLIPRWTSQRRFRFMLSLVPAIFGLVILAPAAFEAAVDLASNWQGENIEGARVSARTEDYDVIRDLVLARPWFGQGFGTFVGDEAFAADNQYLTTLIETGLIGTMALIVFFVMGYVLSRRSFQAAQSDRDRDRAASVTAGIIVGIVCFGVFDAMAFDLTVGSMFLLLALAGALHSVTVLNRAPRDVVPRRDFAEQQPLRPTPTAEAPDDSVEPGVHAVALGGDDD